jgi:ABC-type transporter Mla subunit MlaD
MARPPDNNLAGTTTVSYAALDGTRDKLNDLAAQFQNTAAEVGARHD